MVNVATSASTPAGTYALTITGTSGTLSHSARVTLVVNAPVTPDFSISASPSSQTVLPGSQTSYTTTVTPTGGFTGDVSLTVSGLPTGTTAAFSPSSIAGGSGVSSLNVSTSSSTPAGTYTLTITGVNGALTHSTAVTLIVSTGSSPNFSLSVSPSSQVVFRGAPAMFAATVIPSGGFNGDVTLSVRGLPDGVTASFFPNPITGGFGSSILTIYTSGATPVGTYTLSIIGASGNLTHRKNVKLTVQ